MKNPRHIAVEALLKVTEKGAYSNLTLDSLILKYDLDSRDASFAGAVFYGVLERMVTLDACIAPHSKIPVEKLSPAVLQVLRAGIYQMLYMDSVPDSAAVNESVNLIKKLRKAQASGFVNGVLRSFLRSDKKIPVPKGPLCARLSVEYACPELLVKLWLDGYGEEATRRILAASLGRPPLYLRVNTLLITPEELISRLSAHGVEAQNVSGVPNCISVNKTGAIAKLPEYRRGFYHVQDISSQLAVQALEAAPGMRVLDCCSAPGGKAFTLFQLMEGKGEIIATDLHQHRVQLIGERAKQMKLAGISARVSDMTVFDETLGSFDRVLCDVPCSGLGVIRRKPEIKYKQFADFEELPKLQYKILETASQYCKAGGRLVYSTCTLNPVENQAVTEKFLQAHPAFEKAVLPELLGGDYCHTMLGQRDSDGFFVAAFTKKEDA